MTFYIVKNRKGTIDWKQVFLYHLDLEINQISYFGLYKRNLLKMK